MGRTDCPSPHDARRKGDQAGYRGWGSNPYSEHSRQHDEPYCEDADRAWRSGYHAGEERHQEEAAEEAHAARLAAEQAAAEQAAEAEYWAAQEEAEAWELAAAEQEQMTEQESQELEPTETDE